MKKIKEEKGSITLFVLISMIFFVMYLVGMYMLTSNSESSQTAQTARIKEIYEQNIDNIEDVYKTLSNEKLNGYTEDGLVAYYDFKQNDAIQGTILKDLSGNGNDGTINGATLQNGALNFDGVNDWVAIKKLNYKNITIEAVMEYDDTPTSGEATIVANFEGGGYGLVTDNNLYNRFGVNIGGSYYNAQSASKITKNTIYYLSGNYDGKNITLFENGSFAQQEKIGTVQDATNNTIMALGTNPTGSATGGAYLKGKIYAIRIYNRALTQQEIINNYNIDKVRFRK